LGKACLLTGRIDAASALAAQAHNLSQVHKGRGHEAWALHLLGDIAMHREPPETDQANTRYQHALVLADELGMDPLQSHCHRSLGLLYRQAGQTEQACIELSTAINMYRAMKMSFWLPEIEATLAELKSEQ
jgi:hypothetical protein